MACPPAAFVTMCYILPPHALCGFRCPGASLSMLPLARGCNSRLTRFELPIFLFAPTPVPPLHAPQVLHRSAPLRARRFPLFWDQGVLTSWHRDVIGVQGRFLLRHPGLISLLFSTAPHPPIPPVLGSLFPPLPALISVAHCHFTRSLTFRPTFHYLFLPCRILFSHCNTYLPPVAHFCGSSCPLSPRTRFFCFRLPLTSLTCHA